MNTDAELIVIDSCINNEENLPFVLGELIPTDFENDHNQKAFNAIWDLYLAEKPVDIITLKQKYKEFNLDIPGNYYLRGFKLEFYVNKVKEESEKRKFKCYMVDALKRLSGEDATIEELRHELNENLNQYSRTKKLQHIKTAQMQIDAYKKRLLAIEGNLLKTGIDHIDADIRGIASGEVLTIIARAGAFKTAFLQNIIKKYISVSGYASMFLSLEMPTASLAERFFSIIEQEPGYVIERNYQDINAEFVRTATEKYLNEMNNLYVVDSEIKLTDIASYKSIIETKYRKTVGMIGIDYLGLIDGEGRSEYEIVSKLARQIKTDIARKLDVPVVLLCQTNRKGGDGTEELFLDSARSSGSIEESADVLLGLWKDENKVYCKILKNRKGREGQIYELEVNRSTLTFGAHAEHHIKPTTKTNFER